MRLYLLPISTRRTLIYCERVIDNTPPSKQGWMEWGVNKANKNWAEWEKSTTWWKVKTTEWGNKVFRRIPFEEWGLKSIPPMRKRVQAATGEQEKADAKVYSTFGHEHAAPRKTASGLEVRFPKLYQGLCPESPLETLMRLGVERQTLHRRRMWWSIVGLPITAPIGLLPIVPNIPFFYLAFRAWSHYRALAGSLHLEHLMKNSLVTPSPSSTLDSLYTAGLVYPNRDESRAAPEPSSEQSEKVADLVKKQTNGGQEDVMLLHRWNGKLIAERLKLPEMEVEIERAVEQVEGGMAKEKQERMEEKEELVRARKQYQAEAQNSNDTEKKRNDGEVK